MIDDDDDPYFREFLHEFHEHAARQSELADPNFRHTPACIAARKQWKLDDREWRKQWPNFCRKCGGVGSFAGYDDLIECEKCYEKDLCPRCNAKFVDEPDNLDTPLCIECGYDYDPERPEEPRCNCTGDGKTERKSH